MFTNINHLLTTDISHDNLYDFSTRALDSANELLGNNPEMGFLKEALIQAVASMEMALCRSLKQPLTKEVNSKHQERLDLLGALRHYLNAAEKRIRNPERVEAARAFKQDMKARGWWVSGRLSYSEASVIARSMSEKITQHPYVQWIEVLGIEEILEEIRLCQEEFDLLTKDRIEAKSSDPTPQLKIARKKLVYEIAYFLSLIDHGINNNPKVYEMIGSSINELIIETNAKTRIQQTLADNSVQEVAREGQSASDSLVGVDHDQSMQSPGFDEDSEAETVSNRESIVVVPTKGLQ